MAELEPMAERTDWLTDEQQAAWVRLVAVVELLPGVLDSQLRRDAQLTHFEYYVLAILSASPGQTLRMTSLARQANATLPRLSHVVQRLEERGLLERSPCPENSRATDVRLTSAGLDKLGHTAPGHVANVRRHVIDALTADQVAQLTTIAAAVLAGLDPDGASYAAHRVEDRVEDARGTAECRSDASVR